MSSPPVPLIDVVAGAAGDDVAPLSPVITFGRAPRRSSAVITFRHGRTTRVGALAGVLRGRDGQVDRDDDRRVGEVGRVEARSTVDRVVAVAAVERRRSRRGR